MKILRMVAMLLLAVVSGTACAEDLGLARLSLVKGDVQVLAGDADEWVPAVANMPLAEGDRVWVPEGGRTEMQIRGGVHLRLDASSSLDIVGLRDESFQFYLAEGRTYINNRKGGVDYIQVDTPYASTGIFDTSIVMVDAVPSGDTDVSVIRGYALVETERGKTRVPAGYALYLADGGGAEMAPIDPPDEWENWNRVRDRRLADAAESLRYLPDELDEYAYDLDDYGRWHYLREYGYVWAPRVSLSVGWSPYRLGRWVWVRGSYVWISHEPWGWVPYHYGRWTHTARHGWCWVPPSRGGAWWGPGYVGWVHTPTSVAWVPLAPGETYYGYGSYGPHSVNITNVTVPRTVVREFRNVRVRNAVTAIHRDTFISGKKHRAAVRHNPFTAADASVGPPRFKPARETRRPVIKAIPAERRPPERVKRVRMEEIRRERRLVPSEKGSVFTPGRQPGDLRVHRREAPRRTVGAPSPPPAVRDQGVKASSPQRDRGKDMIERKRRSPGAPVNVPGKGWEERSVRPQKSPSPVTAPPAVQGQPKPEAAPPVKRSHPRQERPVRPQKSPSPVTAPPAVQGQSTPGTAPPVTRSHPRQERSVPVVPRTGRGEGQPQRHGAEMRETGEHGATVAPMPVPAQQPVNAPPESGGKGRETRENGAR